MIFPSRRGIVGLMLTIALGIALGAATLLVGKEVAKGVEKKLPASMPENSGRELEEAFRSYQAARQSFLEAKSRKATDLRQKGEMLKKAESCLQKALRLNTPEIAPIEQPPKYPPKQKNSNSNPFTEDPVKAGALTPNPGYSETEPNQ